MDDLYRQLEQDPTNVELNLRFAEAAEERGDLEAAIGALERILTAHPDLANVRLSLGRLYAALGSYAMARAYIQPLAGAPNIAPDLRAQATAALKDVDRDASPSQFSGTFFAGAQWQSDPGAAPGSPLFLIAGVPQQVNQSFAKRPDNDVFAQATGTYTYALGTPDDDKLELDGLGYGASYRRLHQLDTSLGQATFGPRLGTGRFGLEGGTLRPYALAGLVRLGGAPYDDAYGGGIDYVQPLGGALPKLDLGYEAQQTNYHETTNYPTARMLNGRLDRYQLTFAEPFGEVVSAEFGTVITRQNTRFSGYSNTDFALVAGVTLSYDVPRVTFGYPFVTTLELARHYIPYDGADPSVAPGIKRTDRSWQITLGEIVPVTDRLSLAALVSREINTSNVINYAYGNTSFTVGPQLSF